jgi:2-oxoglutarate ferredoxin oxidoreductase subunit gamma
LEYCQAKGKNKIGKMAIEIRISGSGGQGVILAGVILAEAVGIYEHKEVIHIQDYGGAMRGGAVRSEVLIANKGEEIDYPAVTYADIFVAMTQEAANRWSELIKQNGIAIYDSTFVKDLSPLFKRYYNVPLTDIVEQKLGTKMGANIAALGIICKLSGLVAEGALEQAMLQRIPKGQNSLNKEALKIGIELGRGLSKLENKSTAE